MLLTSMGTFGFLSGAHSEQSAVSGDVAAKVAIIDEKIKTQRDNIEIARKALQQMDAQVDARLSRGDSENSAERAVAIRRQQAGERNRLLKEIADAQAVVAKLNEERAPIASQLRKVEAEVGPVKYIAALIYGDNPDATTLERAVRWVIIMLVIVFDPFAIALVLAGNASRNWRDPDELLRKQLEEQEAEESAVATTQPVEQQRQQTIADIENSTPWPTEWTPSSEPQSEASKEEEFDWRKFPYLQKGGFGFKENKPMVYNPPEAEQQQLTTEPVSGDPTLECVKCGTTLETAPGIGSWCPNQECGQLSRVQEEDDLPPAPQSVVATPPAVEPTAQTLDVNPLLTRERLPHFGLRADGEGRDITTGFGTQFPTSANRGDVFVRVDMLPNKVYKWDGNHWIEVSKTNTDSYIYNEAYIEYLISKVDNGEYDVELLTDNEKDQIRAYLHTVKSGRNILDNNS